MENVTVDLNNPSLYEEPDSKFYRFIRKLKTGPVLKQLRKIAKKNPKFSLLEVGTGSGFLLTFLESEFPDSKLTGVEYDSRLVTLSQSKIKNSRIIQGNAESFDLMGEKFDIIVSLQVIEHLYNPDLMIDCVIKHLNPDGIFVLTTPNLECISEKYMNQKWHGYRPDHVSLKTYTDWKSFIEERGFSSIYCGSTFFSGIPILNKLPFGVLNWGLLFFIGSIKWKYGESFIGVFKVNCNNNSATLK